jgi:hypothetical protein
MPRREPNLTYRLPRVLHPALRKLAPGAVVSSVDLARAMLLAGLYGTNVVVGPVLENTDIQAPLTKQQKNP